MSDDDDVVWRWDHATSGWVRDYRVPPGIARLLIERTKVKPADRLRECVNLPPSIEAEVRRLKQKFTDDGDDEALAALTELQWINYPLSRARHDAKITQAQRAKREREAEMFDLQVEAAQHGYVLRGNHWIHIDDLSLFPGGLPNRFGPHGRK